MATPTRINKIIDSIKKLHAEDPKDGHSTPFIIEAKPRGPTYYQPYINNPSESLWVEREINIGVTGPPSLFPNGENWIDEETGEEMSGLKEWPQTHSYVSRNLEQDGIDALAWYRSFHYEPIHKWGIYMLDKGVYHLAERFEKQYDPSEVTSETRQECIHDAVNLLYYHELFHFYTDLAAANLEISESRSMYVDYFQNRYPDGWLKSDGAPSDILAMLEEALANEFARSRTITNRSRQYKETLAAFMKSQPSGYAQWGAVKHSQRWYFGLSKLGERLLNPDDPFPQHMHVRALEDAIHRSYERQVPVFIVDTIPDDIYRFTSFQIDINNYTWATSFKDNYEKSQQRTKDDFRKSERYIRTNGKINPGRRPERIAGKKDNRYWKYKVSGDNQHRAVLDRIDKKYILLGARKNIYKKMKKRK